MFRQTLRTRLFQNQTPPCSTRASSASSWQSGESDILDRLQSSCSETELSDGDDNWCRLLQVEEATDVESDFEDLADNDSAFLSECSSGNENEEEKNCDSDNESNPSWYYEHYPKR